MAVINNKIEKENKSTSVVNSQKKIGQITDVIGQGDDAKNSIIYLVVKYGFITGSVITIVVAINYWCFRQNEKIPDFTSDIKIIWEMIIPVITLTLGYAFGKSAK